MYPQQNTQPGIYRGFEQPLGRALYSGQSEKSYTDKLLAIKEVNEIKDIIQQDQLSATDLRRMVYLLTAVESKLVNYGMKDRYLLAKFLTWIRDIVTMQVTTIKLKEQSDNDPKATGVTKKNHKSIYEMLDEDIKFCCDIFLFLSRSTLSIGGTAFDQLGKNRNEFVYGGVPGYSPTENKSTFHIKGLGK